MSSKFKTFFQDLMNSNNDNDQDISGDRESNDTFYDELDNPIQPYEIVSEIKRLKQIEPLA